jgi:hypothetical protein
MPPGIFPPHIVPYSATSVPVVQIAISSDTLTEQQIFDCASNFIIQWSRSRKRRLFARSA